MILANESGGWYRLSLGDNFYFRPLATFMTQNRYSIAITTFDLRFEAFLMPLISSIKAFRAEIEILVMVNGPAKGQFNPDYRRKLLQFLSTQENVFPTIFPNFQALAKLWNRAALTATNNRILILNDDLSFEPNTSPNFFTLLENALEDQGDAFKINGSFSHFVVSKEELITVGFFDERLLGIGEEDGDFVWRYYEKFKKEIPSINIAGINNIQSNIADTGFNKGISHYSQFNREFIKTEKYQEVMLGGYKGMFDKRSKKKLIDEVQYPYEAFYLKYRHKL